LVCLSGPLSS